MESPPLTPSNQSSRASRIRRLSQKSRHRETITTPTTNAISSNEDSIVALSSADDTAATADETDLKSPSKVKKAATTPSRMSRLRRLSVTNRSKVQKAMIARAEKGSKSPKQALTDVIIETEDTAVAEKSPKSPEQALADVVIETEDKAVAEKGPESPKHVPARQATALTDVIIIETDEIAAAPPRPLSTAPGPSKIELVDPTLPKSQDIKLPDTKQHAPGRAKPATSSPSRMARLKRLSVTNRSKVQKAMIAEKGSKSPKQASTDVVIETKDTATAEKVPKSPKVALTDVIIETEDTAVAEKGLESTKHVHGRQSHTARQATSLMDVVIETEEIAVAEKGSKSPKQALTDVILETDEIAVAEKGSKSPKQALTDVKIETGDLEKENQINLSLDSCTEDAFTFELDKAPANIIAKYKVLKEKEKNQAASGNIFVVEAKHIAILLQSNQEIESLLLQRKEHAQLTKEIEQRRKRIPDNKFVVVLLDNQSTFLEQVGYATCALAIGKDKLISLLMQQLRNQFNAKLRKVVSSLPISKTMATATPTTMIIFGVGVAVGFVLGCLVKNRFNTHSIITDALNAMV